MLLQTAEEAFGLLAVLPSSKALSEAEVDRWEVETGISFAADFRRLLRIAGGSLRLLFPGGLGHPSEILELRRDATELAAPAGWALEPADMVIEFFDQGYGFLFLRQSASGSRVFVYREGALGPEETGLDLGLYLVGAVERHLGKGSTK
jgi:hypothetical protein